MHNLELKVEPSLSTDTQLWRYSDLPKFVSLLDSASLWLARSDTFKDQSEGRFPHEMRTAIEQAYDRFGNKDDSRIKDVDDFQEYLCRNAYISCWHKNTDENMVMWEIYGRDSNSIAIQTTVGNLKENISNIPSGGIEFHLKPVLYAKPEDIEGKQKYITPFFRKRPHFSFEQEARIVLSTYSALSPKKDTQLGIPVKIDLAQAIDKILVHPDSQDWFLSVVKSITAKYGLSVPVERGSCGNNL